ncbi:MAG: hypothetical protein K9H16_09120 [Bacteroidales bacterium]|nr:hypothetical protein [Bacteroidales bacterium]
MRIFRFLFIVLLGVLAIEVYPQDSFGPDHYSCADGNPINIPCVGNGDWSNYQLIESGDGYFNGYAPFMCPWSIDYYPGPGDLQNGQVNFCLILYNSWGVISFYDCITFFFQPLPSVDAGADITVQADEEVSLTGYAENYSSTIWFTDGDGSFQDNTSLSTIYLPGTQDILNGAVDLCVAANAVVPCAGIVQDCLTLTINSNTCQDLLLHQGWSGLSLYLAPDYPSIEDIFNDPENNLIIMYCADGIYFPQANINTLENWDNSTGYVIKMENEVSISVCGNPLQTKTVSLQSGWNYLPVMSSSPVNCMQLLSQVMDDIIIVKEIAGTKVFWPEANINTLDSLHPGAGYLIKTEANTIITFP